MTTPNPQQQGPRPSARPAPARPSAAASRFNVAIDPIKLVRQHLLLLIITVVIGAGVGVGAHLLLARNYPIFRGEAAFEFIAQITTAEEAATTVGVGSEAEIERFINTQRMFMVSPQLLRHAVNNQELRDQSRWARRFYSNGQYSPIDAALELEEIVNARAIAGTNVVLLRATATNAADAALIVNAVVDEYRRQLSSANRSADLDVEESLTNRLNAVREERRLLETRMSRILLDNNLASTDERATPEYTQLQRLQPQLQETRFQLDTMRALLQSYEETLQAPGGASFPEDVRAMVREEPIIRDLEISIARAEADLRSVIDQFGRNHRDATRLANYIAARQARLRIEEESLLNLRFRESIDRVRTQIRQLEAAEAETLTLMETLQRRLSDIKAILAEREILQKDSDRAAEADSDINKRLAEYRAISARDAASRVSLQYRASVPPRPIFPKIYIIVPVSTMLFLLIVSGVIFLRELVEQRVRGPADVAIIPRAKVLGLVPHLDEDPSRPESIEQAMFSRPNGVVAESVRHIRSGLMKTFAQRGHKTLVVIGGVPGSGATSFSVNLATSCAAGEMRVLVVDANFRRPGLHKALELQDTPGLADVLARRVAFEDAVLESSVPNLFVMPAGTPSERVTERLITSAMSEALARARADYDLVIIDSPPAIVSSDAITLAGRCDAALLVVRAFNEKRGLVARICAQIEETRTDFAGVVVNAVRASAGGYFRRNFRATHEYMNDTAVRPGGRLGRAAEKEKAGAHVNGQVDD